VRVQGDAFNDRLSWLVGGFYSNEDIQQQQNFSLGDDFDPLVGALFGGLAGPAPLSLFAGGGTPANSSTNNFFTQDSDSWSVFTHNTFDITDQLSITGGLRYTDESKDGAFTQPASTNEVCSGLASNVFLGNPLGAPSIPAALPAPTLFALGCFAFTAPADLASPLGPTFASLGIPLPTTFAEEFNDDELIYTVKLGYEVTPDISTYASFTHGFKAGGFNLDSTAAIPVGGVSDPSFESETVDAYEIGVKSKFWDNRITLNIAGFFEDFSNFQVLEFTGTQFQTFNVPTAESLGLEIEATAQVTDNLFFNGGLTLLDTSYPDDCAGDLTAVNVLALCGNDLTNAPSAVGLLGATYSGDLGNAYNFFLNGQVRYESDRRTSTQAIVLPNGAAIAAAGSVQAAIDGATLNPLDIQESTFKINVRAGIGSEEQGWGLEAWATNLTDEVTRGVTFNTPIRGGRSAFVQEPRTYGVTVRKNF
ncbi:TonB-dependent receptor, partial [Hellea sp.]|nr:TonB-dependent receptor [Hellea sp.]